MSTSTPEAHPAPAGVADWLPRIKAAAEAARDADDAARLRHAQRNALIIAAVDDGLSQRRVAAAAGIAHQRVIRLLARSQDEDEALREALDAG